MAAIEYDINIQHMPKIVRNIFGCRPEERSTIAMPGLDSAAIYLGGFVPLVQGSTAAPTGAEFGIPALADDDRILGFVSGFRTKDGSLPLWEDNRKQGTITNGTGELPLKYTFKSTNDESNNQPASPGELAVITPIMPGDILEVSLWGGSTVSVDRGTTTAWGTTTSSANIGVGMSVDTTYHFALTESIAAKNLANLDFITVELDGKKPKLSHRVYVMPIRSFGQFIAAD